MGGESGIGKTRVALEVARLQLGQRMRVVTSEAPALSAQHDSAVGAARSTRCAPCCAQSRTAASKEDPR